MSDAAIADPSRDHTAAAERARLRAVTGALMMSTFLAATETTFVTAAMPTIVTQLGGLAIYSWVFSGFMLSYTASIALFGKLADLYGRRPVYVVAMSVFLLGSFLCGIARDMPQLVAFRVLQGIGAGGLMPIVFTIIGDVYSFEQRARVQGLFASAWGIASVLGPVLGGFLVERVSWRWVFLLNVPAGLIAATVLLIVWKESRRPRPERIDVAGAVLLVAGIVALLVALMATSRAGASREPFVWGLGALAVVLWGMLVRVELRARDPIIPVSLFRKRLFLASCGHSFCVGFGVFGAITFVPLFVQFGSGVGATQAGAALTPLLVSWVVTANVGSRMLLRFPLRSVALCGVTLVVIGVAGMGGITTESSRSFLLRHMLVIGLGMGLSSPVFLIAIQTTLPKRTLGSATSTWQLSRSIGTAIGIAVMGGILTLHVGHGFDAPKAAEPGGPTAVTLPPGFREALAGAERGVFTASLCAALAAWGFAALAPNVRLRDPGPAPEVESAAAGP